MRDALRTRGGLLLCTLLLFLGGTPVLAQDATTFTVTVENKTEEHPFFGQGGAEGFTVDGVQGKTLMLVRGRTYTFQMEGVPALHPFYLTTSAVGASADPVTDGVDGNGATGNQTLTFTPGQNTPDALYYNCQNHQYMGGQILVTDQAEASLQVVAEGLTHPLMLVEAPDGSGRRFIVDQTGQIHILTSDDTLLEEPFLDIEDRMVPLNAGYDERGLLGLAFHPDYADNGRFFVYYSAPLREEAPDDFDNTSHISEFSVSADDPDRADPDSETILLQVDQPQSNHASGVIAFGPDDYLYISLGDGGRANDTGTGHVEDWYDVNAGGNAQDLTQNLLGSILRIDVDTAEGDMPYGIPDDNPFLDTDALPEQWAYGFRNPYRFSFDMGGDRELFVGDAGQDLWEEVSIVTSGGNYGWNVKEGTHCFDAANPQTVPSDCPDTVGEGHPRTGDPLIDPIIEFDNANQDGGLGLTVVGGYVYRGALLPALEGRYVFGTWSQGQDGGQLLPGSVFVAERPDGEGLWPFQPLSFSNRDDLGHFLLGFGQDLDGEVYVLTTDAVGPTGTSGRVYRLDEPEATAREPGPDVPQQLRLYQNYPNPFNPETTIRYRVERQGEVRLTIYDMMGREVARLVDGIIAPGTYEVHWDGRNSAGQPVASGTYLYRLELGGRAESKVMTLLK